MIVEIETAKAVVELPCPYEGTVAALLVDEGETVDVGSADHLGRRRHGDRSRPRRRSRPRPPAERGAARTTTGAVAAKEERQPVLVGYGVKMGTARRRPARRPPRVRRAVRRPVRRAVRRARMPSRSPAASAEPPARSSAWQSEPVLAGTAAAADDRVRRAGARSWPSRRCASSPRTSAST